MAALRNVPMVPTNQRPPKGQRQFERMEVASLYCPKCKRATKVRRRLLLVLPSGEKYTYTCAECGEEVGSEMEVGPSGNPWTAR